MPRRASHRSSNVSLGSMSAALVIIVLVFLYRSCSGTGSLPAPVSATVIAEDAPEWYSVYFTAPNDPASKSLRGGPDAALAAAINRARLSLDVAIYELDLWSIRDALLEAHRRGVSVRMVSESDNLDGAEIQELKEAGIPILGDRRESLMHNKFVVIDRQEVWMGSMNYTVSEAYRNNNNLVRIRSAQLAENYTREFEEMFTEDLFGTSIRRDTPHPTLSVDGTRLEVYFSPDDGTAAHLIDLLGRAQESIFFLAFSFTSDALASAMLERAEAGVTVAGIFEETQYFSNTGTEYERFRSAGLDVRLDGNPRNLHHKVIIIDGRIVVTGSYNFSSNAENRNDENTLVIHNPDIAGLFVAEFKRLFTQSKK